MTPENFYADSIRARAYASLGITGKYAIAFRKLASILCSRATRGHALDFGCGAGRSTRFLRDLGFDAVGVDIAAEMVSQARASDPDGDYRVLPDFELGWYGTGRFKVVLVCWALDNVASDEMRRTVLRELRRLMSPRGAMLLVGSTPELYVNEWDTFTTKRFPENRDATPGDTVRISIKDVGDDRPYEDILYPDSAYRALFSEVDLSVRASHLPLGRPDDPEQWTSELRIAPWVI